MGDVVEPRRELFKKTPLKVKNIDISVLFIEWNSTNFKNSTTCA